jgi:uncharacterized protein YgbK (DUF1537 family)
MYLGVIADDITGASDLASMVRRAGARVVLAFGVPEEAPPAADVVVVATKTRQAEPEQAQATAVAAARVLKAAGAAQLYFKYCSTFDSTDRGNIGPVTQALLEMTGDGFTVTTPAYPELGRTVYNGHLFVGAQLLSESSMRDHPLTPMTDPDLVRVLGRQCGLKVGLVPLNDVSAGPDAVRAKFAALATSGIGVAILDAVGPGDLDTLAKVCADLPFVGGGAGLAGAIARAHSGMAAHAAAATRLAGPIACLSGSCSAATLEQVERLRAITPSLRLDPLALAEGPAALEDAVRWARETAQGGHLLIYSTATSRGVGEMHARLGREHAAALVETAFGRIAAALAAEGVRNFVVAGGETSGAVAEALGLKMMALGEEIAPGVPWAHSLTPPGYTLAMKSGNFGGPDFFLRALEAAA